MRRPGRTRAGPLEARNERLEKEQQARDDELAQQKATAKQAGPPQLPEILKRSQKKRDQDEGDD